jgi:hypothetical protein
MRTIRYESQVEHDKTVSAVLRMFLECAQAIGLFSLLGRRVKVQMKGVVYSVLNKAPTVMASLVMGGQHTKASHEGLSREEMAANYLGLMRFPDQWHINRYLTRFSEDNVAQLGQVQPEMFIQQSQARRRLGRVVVDIDQCGRVVTGKTFELARKGYFPRKRGKIGDQLSVAYLGAYQEAVQVYLEPGNSVGSNRLVDLLHDLAVSLTNDNPGVCLVRRLDAGYDSAAKRALLASLPGFFIVKGRDTRLAKRLAQTSTDQQWIPIADAGHGLELPADGNVRCFLYDFWQADLQHEYSLMYTNLPAADLTVAGAFAFYNQRTSLEAFFAQSRHVFNIQAMRSRKFNAIFAFLRFVFLTHNILVWARQAGLADADFAPLSTRELLEPTHRIRAHITWDGFFRVWIIGAERWACAFRDTLSRPPPLIQLALPFARLYESLVVKTLKLTTA